MCCMLTCPEVEDAMAAHRVPRCQRDPSVYPRLRMALANFEFTPGQQLHINDMADRYQVSSTPVREALNRLLQEKLAVSVPGKGYYCRKLDVEEMLALHELTATILDASLTKILASANNTERDKLLEAIGAPLRQLPTPDSTDMSEPNASYLEGVYETISRTACNKEYVSIVRNVIIRTYFLRRIDFGVKDRISLMRREISELVIAIDKRDVLECRKILNFYFEAKRELLPVIVREGLLRLYWDRQLPAKGNSLKMDELLTAP